MCVSHLLDGLLVLIMSFPSGGWGIAPSVLFPHQASCGWGVGIKCVFTIWWMGH